jgi:alpha-1,2-mannosyltransferase
MSLLNALRAGQDDLYVYVLAIRAVADGLPLYDIRAPNGDPFIYPPVAALALWPVSWVSRRWADGLWTAGSLVVLLGVVVALAWRKRWVWSRSVWWTVVLGSFALLLVSTPSQLNLGLGQVSALVVLLVLLDVLKVTPPALRGICLGVAAAVKLTPLVFVVYLLVCGRAREGCRAAVVFVGCGALALVVLPADSVTYWTDAVFHMEARLGYLDYVDNQSAQGLLLRAGTSLALWPALASTVMLFSLYQARMLTRAGLDTHGVLIVGCAAIVASPISWGHHLFWVVLAGLWLLWSGRLVQMAAGVAVLVVMTIEPDLGATQHGVAGLITVNTRLFTALVLACGVLLWAGRATVDGAHLVSFVGSERRRYGGSRRRVRRVRPGARR